MGFIKNYNVKNKLIYRFIFSRQFQKNKDDLILDVSKTRSNLFIFEIIGNGPYKKKWKKKISENLNNVHFLMHW